MGQHVLYEFSMWQFYFSCGELLRCFFSFLVMNSQHHCACYGTWRAARKKPKQYQHVSLTVYVSFDNSQHHYYNSLLEGLLVRMCLWCFLCLLFFCGIAQSADIDKADTTKSWQSNMFSL